MRVSRRITIDDVKALVDSNGLCLLTDKYKNKNTILAIECPSGHITSRSYWNFMRKPGCKVCNKTEAHSHESVTEHMRQFGFTLLPQSDTYKNNRTILTVRCPNGHHFTISYTGFVKSNGKCSACIGRRHTVTDIVSYVNGRGFSFLSSPSVDINSVSDIEIQCPSGHAIRTTLRKFRGRQFGCKECYKLSISGEGSPVYNPHRTDDERQRWSLDYKQWRTDVYTRDGFACVRCHSIGGTLTSHHLDCFAMFKEKRTDIDNGVTLCRKCHRSFHTTYGTHNNTREQFVEWIGRNDLSEPQPTRWKYRRRRK